MGKEIKLLGTLYTPVLFINSFFYFTVDVPPLPIQVAVSAYLQESLAQSERQKVTYITFIKKTLTNSNLFFVLRSFQTKL